MNFNDELIELYIIKLQKDLSVDHEEVFELRKKLSAFKYVHEDFFNSIVLKMLNENPYSLNVMSMIGGPYSLKDCSDIKIENQLAQSIHISFNYCGVRYAGTIPIFENVCGIDNLKKIIDYSFEHEGEI